MSPEVTATAPSSWLRRSASRPLHFELSARARRYIRLLLSIGRAEDIILDGGTGLGCLSPAQMAARGRTTRGHPGLLRGRLET